MRAAPRWSPAICHALNKLRCSAHNGSPARSSTAARIRSTFCRCMAQACGLRPATRPRAEPVTGCRQAPKPSPQNPRRKTAAAGDADSKIYIHPAGFKSRLASCNAPRSARQPNTKPRLRSAVLLTRPLHYHAAIQHLLSPPLTAIGAENLTRPNTATSAHFIRSIFRCDLNLPLGGTLAARPVAQRRFPCKVALVWRCLRH